MIEFFIIYLRATLTVQKFFRMFLAKN